MQAMSSSSTSIEYPTLQELKLQVLKIHNGFVLSWYSRGKCFANDIVFIAKAHGSSIAQWESAKLVIVRSKVIGQRLLVKGYAVKGYCYNLDARLTAFH